MPFRSARLVWIGRAISAAIITGLVLYLVIAGLDKADKVASSVSVVVALIALVAPYVFSPAPPAGPVHAPGVGAVALGGDNQGETSTDVTGIAPPTASTPPHAGVTASGSGSVAIGGSNRAPIKTKVTGPGSSSPPANQL